MYCLPVIWRPALLRTVMKITWGGKDKQDGKDGEGEGEEEEDEEEEEEEEEEEVEEMGMERDFRF